MFSPSSKIVVTLFQENVKILTSTPDVMITIKDDVATNMAFNDNALLTKEVN
jgi:hypothetical protein